MENLTKKQDDDDSDPRSQELLTGNSAGQITNAPKPKVKHGLSECEPCSSKKINSMEGGVVEWDEEAADSKNIFSEQILIAPHLQSLVLSLILKKLDFRSLKHVRLVRKSWLYEAQTEMQERGIVSLYTEYGCSVRIHNFLRLMDGEIVTALPHPFKNIDVDLRNIKVLIEGESPELLVRQLVILRPHIGITRLSPWPLPLNLAKQLIQQCSPTLEYLKLIFAELEGDAGTEPPENPELTTFPNLRQVVVDYSNLPDRLVSWDCFFSLVAMAVNGSPNLEHYETLTTGRSCLSMFESELLLKLDLKTVKTLSLAVHHLCNPALKHLSSIPFSRLQSLTTWISKLDYRSLSIINCIVGIVNKSVSTLRKLTISGIPDTTKLALFPKCPNVLEVSLDIFPTSEQYFKSLEFLSRTFPALRVLNVKEFIFGESLRTRMTPFPGLKTLRAKTVKCQPPTFNQLPLPEQFLFFEMFPNLECLCVEPSVLMSACQLKAIPETRSLNLLDSLSALELQGNDAEYGDPNSDADFSFLAILKRLETITFQRFCRAITTVPVQDLPCLKTIQFPWGPEVESTELLEFAKAVDVVIVTNCCPILRTRDSWSRVLQSFFDSTPNAQCGCK